MFGTEQYNDFEAHGKRLIAEKTVQLEARTGARMEVGSEIEFLVSYVKSGDDAPEINIKDLSNIQKRMEQIAAEQGITEKFKFKLEGMAFVAHGPEWLTIGGDGKQVFNNDDRWFIPDRKVEDVLDHTKAPRIARFETVIDHTGVSPLRAVELNQAFQQITADAMRDLYPGIRVTARPKITQDIDGIIREDAAILYLKNTRRRPANPNDLSTVIPADSTATTLKEVYELHGVRVVPQIPGIANQFNRSFVDKETGANLYNGPEVDVDVRGKALKDHRFSDFAWQIHAGETLVQLSSLIGFQTNPEAALRTAKKERTLLQMADDATQCKPGLIGLMEDDARKFDPTSASSMLRPYSLKATDSIAGMSFDPTRKAAEKEGDAYGRKPSDMRGGIYDHDETRVTANTCDLTTQMLMKLIGAEVGLDNFGHMKAGEIQQYFAQSGMTRQVGESIAEELELFRASEVHHKHLPEDYRVKLEEFVEHQITHNKPRGDDGFKAYCQRDDRALAR